MFNTIKLDANQRKAVKPLIQAIFPKYSGRKVSVSIQSKPMQFLSIWDGGSKDTFVAIDLNTLETKSVPESALGRPVLSGMIPAGVAVIEHSWFCGKDVGITIHINPVDSKMLEKATAQISFDDIVDAESVKLLA